MVFHMADVPHGRCWRLDPHPQVVGGDSGVVSSDGWSPCIIIHICQHFKGDHFKLEPGACLCSQYGISLNAKIGVLSSEGRCVLQILE